MRIKELRKKKGVSQQVLADSVGISRSAVAMWEKGTEPSNEMLSVLADYFGVTIDYLLDRKPTGTRIPVLGRIPAGIPLEAIEDILDWEEIPKEWVTGDKQYFALKVRGDSMSPEYLDGDIIILQRASDCDSGKDCAVMVNGNDATFKRVRKKGQTLILQPLNHNYDPFIYTEEEVKQLPVTILGFVVEQRRKR